MQLIIREQDLQTDNTCRTLKKSKILKIDQNMSLRKVNELLPLKYEKVKKFYKISWGTQFSCCC